MNPSVSTGQVGSGKGSFLGKDDSFTELFDHIHELLIYNLKGHYHKIEEFSKSFRSCGDI